MLQRLASMGRYGVPVHLPSCSQLRSSFHLAGPGAERSQFVATDQKTSDVLTDPLAGSVIENELPTYRAISPRAVLSLLCGILAIFSLAHPFFYVFAILAVVLGFTADRNIQRYP